MTKNEAIQKALLLEAANANLEKLCDKRQKTIDLQLQRHQEYQQLYDGQMLISEQYSQRLIYLSALLTECVPMLHTGDELPVSYYMESAPDCLLARVAKAVNFTESV